MISLRKSANELDRLTELNEAATKCYDLALKSVAQYAIEADPKDLAEFREHLDAIGAAWRKADGSEALHAAQASFRGELREYREQVHQRITRLRTEVEAGAKAMATFAASITTSGADHEQQLKRELSRLETASRSDNAEEIRNVIRNAVATIASSVEQIRRTNQMMIAQWQDEIRMLHQEFQAERRTLFMDAGSGAWNRLKVDQRIDELLRQNQTFCVLMIAVRNLSKLERRHSRTVVDGALKAMIRRLHTVAGSDAFIGRWSEEEFVAILDVQPAAAMALSRDATRKLSGGYTVQENAVSHDAVVEVKAGVIERGASADAAAVLKKLNQMSAALTHP